MGLPHFVPAAERPKNLLNTVLRLWSMMDYDFFAVRLKK